MFKNDEPHFNRTDYEIQHKFKVKHIQIGERALTSERAMKIFLFFNFLEIDIEYRKCHINANYENTFTNCNKWTGKIDFRVKSEE